MAKLPALKLCQPIGLFVCTETGCNVAIKATGLESHLRRRHRLGLALAKREALGLQEGHDISGAMPLQFRYINDPYPREGEAPLPSLPFLPIYDVIKCPLCALHFKGSKACKQHLRATHAGHNDVGSALQGLDSGAGVKAQTLFSGPQKRYFPVTVTKRTIHPCEKSASEGVHSTIDMTAALFPKEDASSRRGADFMSLNEKSLPLSAKVVGVKAILQRLKMTCEDAFEITKVDCKATFSQVTKFLLLYADHFSQLQPPVPTSVIASLKIRAEGSTASFSLSLPIETRRRYARVVSRITLLCAKLDASARANLFVPDELHSMARMVTSNTTIGAEVKLRCVHKFLRCLLLGAVRASEGETVALEEIFKLVIAGFTRGDGESRARMGGAEDASHTAASLQYFCHITALAEFLVHPRGFGEKSISCNESEEGRKARVQKMISTDECTAAAFLRSVLRKTKRLSAAEAPRVKFAICAEHLYCGKVENLEISMNSGAPASLGCAIRDIHREVSVLMHRELLLGFRIPADVCTTALNFRDNIAAREPGYFFGNHEESSHITKRWASEYAVYLLGVTGPIRKRAENDDQLNLEGSETAAKWLRTADKVAELLYVLVHLCSGGPPRVTEMIEAKLRNTPSGMRNIFIYNGMLCFMVSYSKTSEQFQKPTPIVRFLDETTSRLLLWFIIYVKPIQSCLMKWAIGGSNVTEDYVFCHSGELMNENVVYGAFRDALSARGVPLNVSLYRHYRTGIVKAFMKDFASLTGDSIVFKQAGHSEATASSRYAAIEFDFENFNTAVTEGFLCASSRWQELLGIRGMPGNIADQSCEKENNFSAGLIERSQPGLATAPARNSVCGKRFFGERPGDNSAQHSSELGAQQTRARKARKCEEKCKSKRSQIETIPRPSEDVLGTLADLLEKPPSQVRFSSDAQRAAMFECAMQSNLTEYDMSMLVVLPTGGGKTLCWAAPAVQEQTKYRIGATDVKTTLLVVPLISLECDMLRRCRSFNLAAATWENRFEKEVSVVICPVDKVSGMQYRDFVTSYSAQGRLTRIVVDEAHLILLWAGFRDFSHIKSRLRPDGIKVPLVLLTATAPPGMISDLRRSVGATGSCFKTIRCATGRPNLKYKVIQTATSTQQQMVLLFTDIVKSELESLKANEKLIVYCLTVKDAEMLVSNLNDTCNQSSVQIYHGSMGTNDRERNFQQWLEVDEKPRVMVGTSAFSCGIDYGSVRSVLHMGGSRSIIEFAQESGRAGRDGLPSRSTVVYNEFFLNSRVGSSQKKAVIAPDHGTGSPASLKYVQRIANGFGSFKEFADTHADCRRSILESFLDGQPRGPCGSAEETCDSCLWQSYITEFPELLAACNTGGNGSVAPQDSFNTKNMTEEKSNDRGVLSVEPSFRESGFSGSAIWKAQQLSRLRCAVCITSSNRRKEEVDHHNCMRGRCFRCMAPGANHQSKECTVTPRGTKESMRCFFCGIPKSKDLHAPGTFNIETRCQWVIVKNVALMVWAIPEMRNALMRKIPVLRQCGNDVKHLGRIMCGGEMEHEKVVLAEVVDHLYERFFLRISD